MTAQQPGGLKPTRRTLVKGAAWSVPVVAMAAPAMAVGCSQDPTQLECGCLAGVASETCKYPGDGSSNPAFNKSFRTKICFTATDCGPTAESHIVITDINVTGQGGSCPRDIESDIPAGGFDIVDGGAPQCFWVFFRDDNSGTKQFEFFYTVNGNGPFRLLVTTSSNAYSTTCDEGCGTGTNPPCPPYDTVAGDCPTP